MITYRDSYDLDARQAETIRVFGEAQAVLLANDIRAVIGENAVQSQDAPVSIDEAKALAIKIKSIGQKLKELEVQRASDDQAIRTLENVPREEEEERSRKRKEVLVAVGKVGVALFAGACKAALKRSQSGSRR